MLIRIRSTTGTLRVNCLNDESTIGDLKQALFAEHSIPVFKQKLSLAQEFLVDQGQIDPRQIDLGVLNEPSLMQP